MQTIHLRLSLVNPDCNVIDWKPSEESRNQIENLLIAFDLDVFKTKDTRFKFKFNYLTSNIYSIYAFSFPNTNNLIELVTDAPIEFYLKVALCEFLTAFTVYDYNGKRLLAEDIV